MSVSVRLLCRASAGRSGSTTQAAAPAFPRHGIISLRAEGEWLLFGCSLMFRFPEHKPAIRTGIQVRSPIKFCIFLLEDSLQRKRTLFSPDRDPDEQALITAQGYWAWGVFGLVVQANV